MNLIKLNPYVGKRVNVGIKDRYGNDKIFFYTGLLKEVDLSDNTITLETKNGVVFIHHNQILQISTENLWEV